MILHFFESTSKSIQNINSFDNETPSMSNYSFYNSLDFPLISIILDFGQLKLDNSLLENYILSLLNQSIKDIEIYIHFYDKDNPNITSINNFLKNKQKIHLYISKIKNKIENIFDITNVIKGKFVLIISKMIKFRKEELLYFYNCSKSKINNYFNLRTQSGHELNLIRTKILRDIADKKENFLHLYELFHYIQSMPSPQLTYIPIALSPNDKYTPLAYTSMISILTSKNYYTYIDFYLILPKNFSSENYILFDSLFYQFVYFNITYIQMDDRYKKAFVHRYITNQAYYRFSLGSLLPKLNKIIYLDADTIIFKDLTNLYNLNFKGKIILGKGLGRDIINKNKVYINSGILLLNLKEMRKKEIEKKVLKILNSGFKHPTLHDQAVIDTFFYKYVGLFPPEYNSYLLTKKETFTLIRTTNIYDRDILLFSLRYPTIRHYKGASKELNDDWFFYARKSKFFQKISMNYSYIYNFSL